jgi:hypothetical protein
VETAVIVMVTGAFGLLTLLLLAKIYLAKKLTERLDILSEYVALSQKQINFVSIQLDATIKRVEVTEKVLSALLYGSGGDGGSNNEVVH